jgi:dipeptidyl aminopeptidase/acylaminoacyl peptidase
VRGCGKDHVLKLIASCGGLLAAALAIAPARAAFPGESGRIAYACARDVCTMAPDGSDSRRLTTGGGTFDPAASPDGRQIAFTRGGAIWVMAADGSGAHQVPGLPPGRQPAWSPDGTRIAFSAASPGPPFRIWVAAADGSSPVQLTNQSSGDFSPAWSPDGTRIAYTRTNNSTDIYTVDPSAPGSETPYVASVRTDDQPSWAPDGSAIAFTTNRGSGNDIYVQAGPGGTGAPVTSDPADDHDPSFSPDGTRIAFSSNRGGSPHIWSVLAGGVEQGALDLSAAGGSTTADDQPDWAPRVVVPPPVIGKSVNAEAVKGTVRVAVPSAGGAPGRLTFVPLESLRQVPVGSTFDTSRGTVKLTFGAGAGRTQEGRFNGGRFTTLQAPGRALTEVRMSGGGLNRCSRRPRGGAASARTRSRRLFASVRGRFRTRGRNSTATVRGTRYLVKDTCKGTLTTVSQGRVDVRDLTKRKTVRLRAGGRYFARAPRR